MNALLHSLHISTLATWLSVVGFGCVGVLLQNPHPHRPTAPAVLESHWIARDFTLGDENSAAPEQSTPVAPADTHFSEALPTPPELPETTHLGPLPEVPELPARPASRKTSASTRSSSRTASNKAKTGGTRSSSATGNTNSRPRGKPAMSASARLAAGNMPPPSYPSAARRRGQTGTVLVEFTVDSSGRVISAVAKSPSPWPLLNQEAVRTVRRWSFPPGSVMKLQRPIVFQLR